MNDQKSNPKNVSGAAVNDTAAEQLSALMDGQLPKDQVRFLLRRIDIEPALADRWSRQHMARAVLRHEFVVLNPSQDFVAAVMAKLEPGSTGHDKLVRRPIAMRVLRWTGGGAIAAAVAIVALVVSKPGAENGGVHTAPIASVSMPMSVQPAGRDAHLSVPEAFALPASFDYAQPASFEKVQEYSPPRRYVPQYGGVPNGFLPSVLVPFGPGGTSPVRRVAAPQAGDAGQNMPTAQP